MYIVQPRSSFTHLHPSLTSSLPLTGDPRHNVWKECNFSTPPVGQYDGRSIIHNFLKGLEVLTLSTSDAGLGYYKRLP